MSARKGTRKARERTSEATSEFLERPSSSQMHAELVRKYQALGKKYADAVSKLDHHARIDAQASKLAWWALRTSGSGLALIRNAKILVSNPRWAELCGRHRAHWSLVDEAGKRQETERCCQLWEIAIELSEQVSGSGAPREVVAVFESDVDGSSVELRIERTSAPSGTSSIAAIAHDVTARTRELEELDRARTTLFHRERMQAIGEMASGVAHDLNNTLHVMGLRIELMAADEKMRQRHGRHLDALKRIIHDAGKSVGRLQDFARRRRDRPVGVVELSAVVSEAITMARTAIEERPQLDGQRVVLEANLPDLPTVTGGAEELRPVFVNLFLNARDAMPDGGTIRCSAEIEDGKVTIVVEDDGSGIPPENLNKIFDPFFTTKGQRGTGLGLSMAYGVVTRLGGTIAAENREEGGARFRLVFPRADAAAMPVDDRPTLPPVPRQRVLVVDDEPENLSALQALLESHEQRVELANSGAEALEIARSKPHFDLVLCDVGMPGLSGWQVVEELRRLDPQSRIYLLTGWANEIADDDPRRAMVRGVLGKPVEAREIRRLLAPPSNVA